ncbi:MAG TPA: hypothetical protein VK966_10090, partial [Longimicrobiales bacterium]|nr:hypothetical protein [Longimicrobiales bacterium]
MALRANRPVHETELTGAPFYVYPRDGLPLEAGQEYVWQVEALDGMGQPLVGSGLRSEIWRFSLDRSGPVVAGPTLPDTLELVPGVARVIGLTRTDVRTTAFGYRLNGRARLEILAPFRAASSVRLQDVALDVSGTPRVTGGRIVGALDARAVPASHRGEFVALNRVEYAPGSGLVVGGELSLPG